MKYILLAIGGFIFYALFNMIRNSLSIIRDTTINEKGMVNTDLSALKKECSNFLHK